MDEQPRRSDLDSRRFDVEVYRARVHTETSARRVVAFRDEAPVDLMIARIATCDYGTARVLTAGGFYLCDTLVYFEGRTADVLSPTRRFSVRQGENSDRARLAEVAQDAFANFGGHYHQDPRIDGAAATEGYVEWCLASLHDDAGLVLVADTPEGLAGFLTIRRNDGDRAEILLNGVGRQFQRRGVYDELIRAAGARLRDAGVSIVSVSTQIDNLGPQRVWVRQGFEPSGSEYTFHKWYDEASI